MLSRLFDGDDDSFYGPLTAHGDEFIRNEDFPNGYSRPLGRPSIPPWLMMRTV